VNPSPKGRGFELEALEPRLLLSADGLGSIAASEPLLESATPVVVAYAISVDSTSAKGAQESDQSDDIFDVSGQAMEQSVEATETLELDVPGKVGVTAVQVRAELAGEFELTAGLQGNG
jgi:hypothetical protein